MPVKNYISILLLLTTFALGAQNHAVKPQPKVGLVLSGGGAKGFAHIGVLKVIDSLGIKIDYISGTSMGAIIGGLYATGYSGKQLDAMFKAQDFNLLINDAFPRSSKSFYERENAEKYAVSLPFNKFKISLPSALSRGQNVYDLLYQLMLPVNEITDFSKLPIPFFCITTNIETGKSLILDKGRLAEAVTASGALPSFFEPVTIGNDVFIDGGVTNNFPVEELKAKGMDIIIGVDVQDDLKKKDALTSAPEILLQINNFRTIEVMKSKAKLVDVYIKPDISNYSVLSFDEGEDIIANGETAALVNIEGLLKVKSKQNKNTKKPVIYPMDSLKINAITITGKERYTRSYILGKLKFKKNKKINFTEFRKGINNLIATNNFNTFRYYLEPNANNSYNFTGKISESKTSTFLKLGVHYDGLYKSAALVNLTKKRLLFDNDIASLDMVLGDNSRYNFDYFIDKGYYISVGIKSRYNQFHKNVDPSFVLQDNILELTDLNKLDVEIQDVTNQIYLQTLFLNDFAIKMGGEHKFLKITSETLIDGTLNDDFTFESSQYLSLFGNLKYDTYSDSFFPKNGSYFSGDFHFYVNASNFNTNFKSFSIAKADAGYAFSINNKLALKTEVNGGFKIGGNSTTSLDFALGGYGNNFINNFSSFYGYDYLALSSDSFVKATFTLDYEMFKKHHILFAANYANIEDDLFETGNWFSTPNFSGYALGYSLETFLGPLEMKYSYSPETGHSNWFFNLGFWF
ncbi:MAG: patatin-like phospholipase family protein [Winogradskyella sp.]